MIAERPSGWPDVQREFRRLYNSNTTLSRQPVHWRFIPGPPTQPTRGGMSAAIVWFVRRIGWSLSRLRRRQLQNDAPVLAVWPQAGPVGATATVVFEVDPPPTHPEGDGVLVGELAPNAAMCVEVSDGTVLWPTYNPRTPPGHAPRR